MRLHTAGKRQLAIDRGAHLEKFALVNGSVFTVWKNIREALDPAYKPSSSHTHHHVKQVGRPPRTAAPRRPT